MLNLAVGTETTVDGRSHILTRQGERGHAIYGPYQRLDAGKYVVEFTIRLADGADASIDEVCAYIDVVSHQGYRAYASGIVRTPQLVQTGESVRLAFDLSEPAELEYRAYVNGHTPLLIADNPVVLSGDTEVAAYPAPAFMVEHPGLTQGIFRGGRVQVVDGHVVGELKGVRFNARTYDDVNFVHEIFVLGAYNMMTARPTCMIDVGMNVALSSLLFATRDFVKEVHAFEPFAATYERGLKNIALNPGLAPKIRTNNFGLADQDGDVTLRIHDSGDSGAMTTRDSASGTPMTISLRDAGPALRPIIDDARARGLDVIAKIDCEGSEFPVFESLERAGLLKDIRGFMVEWHRMFEGRDQHELIAPLLANDYLVFDVSPPEGNGFFYAVRRD